jgi:hypothetical protein
MGNRSDLCTPGTTRPQIREQSTPQKHTPALSASVSNKKRSVNRKMQSMRFSLQVLVLIGDFNAAETVANRV